MKRNDLWLNVKGNYVLFVEKIGHWLEMLPLDSTAQYVRVFLLDINEMKRNDLWLNVKGNYELFVGKILLNLRLKVN